MKLLSKIVTPFKEDGLVDYSLIKEILDLAFLNCADGIVINGEYGEANYIKKEELILFIKEVRKNTSLPIYVELSPTNVYDLMYIMDKIKDVNNLFLIFDLPDKPHLRQSDIFIYVKNIVKGERIPFFVKNGGNNFLSFFSIKKIEKAFPYFKGIIESTNDKNLINLIKTKLPNLEVYVEDNYEIEKLYERNIDGICSSISLMFGKEIKSIIEDYKFGIVSSFMNSYINYIYDSLSSLSFLSMKYLLSRKIGKEIFPSKFYQKVENVNIEIDET